MWKFVFVCLALAIYGSEAAKRLRAGDVVSSFMAKRSIGAPKPTVHEVLQLTDDEDIESERTMLTARGSLKTRYFETYKGVPIYGSVITADDQDPSDVEGTFVQEIDQDLDDVTPVLSAQDALKVARELEGDSETTNEETKLYIYTHEGKARLIYETNYMVESSDKVSRPFYMIDAKTGESIDNWQGIESHQMGGVGGNSKIGKYYYGQGSTPHLEVHSPDGGRRCVLQNKNVKVINMGTGTTETSTHEVSCNEGAKDEVNGAYSPAHDALHFGGVVFNMFKDWYNTAPLKFSLVMRVHYKVNYQNAFWDGRQMTFGDGGSTFHPLVCLDVTAHEVSHGFTQQNSNLRYKYQSGGMNEAFSDMSGETAEYFSRGKNDWKMGYDIFKQAGKALRYMDNPEKDGKSIGHASKYYRSMNVHYSSGVYNKMFYTLATTSGWNPRKAFGVMVKANQMFWGQDSTFEEGACGVKKAAKDLGLSEADIKDIEKAFSVVGVSVCGSTTPNPQPTQAPQPPSPGGPAKRINGNIANLYGSTGSSKNFYTDVKGVLLYVKTYHVKGNPDIYVKQGSLASPTNYDYKSENGQGLEDFVYAIVKPGRYYINLYAKSSYSGVSMLAFTN